MTSDANDQPSDQPPPEDLQLSILGVRTRPEDSGAGSMVVDLNTTRGIIEMHLHPCEGKTGAAVFISGAAGGVDGPADNVFQRLGSDLVPRGVTSLRVKWREPGEFEECVMDTLAACSFLRGIGAERVVLVGHSFGGAVAIKAAELGDVVGAVAAMSSQRHGTQNVGALEKPLLLVHGSNDDVLDRAASDDIFERATEPKELVILDGVGHSLAEGATEVYDLLTGFISQHAAGEIG